MDDMKDPLHMHQKADYPQILADLIKAVRYKADWSFRLENLDRGQGSHGMTLVITIFTPDAYHPEIMRSVAHFFPVPPAAYDYRSWRRWLFDQILLVERHEAMEFYQIIETGRYVTEGEKYQSWTVRPFAPSHGFGSDPYMIREIGGTATDVKTSFRNEVRS